MWATLRAERAFWPPAAVVLLHVVALAALPAGASLAALAPLEAVAVGLLVVTAGRNDGEGTGMGVVLVAALGLLGVVALGQWRGVEPWILAALLVGVGAFVSYGLHRYERVRLGLVEGELNE